MKKKQFTDLLGLLVVFSALISLDAIADDRPLPRPTLSPLNIEIEPIRFKRSAGASSLVDRTNIQHAESAIVDQYYSFDEVSGDQVFDLCQKQVNSPADLAVLCECIANQSHDLSDESVQIENNICRANIEQAMPFSLSGTSFVLDLDEIFRPKSNYHNIEPEEASRVCQQAVDKGLVTDYGNTINSYMNSAVLGEFLKMAGHTGVNCSADGMKNRFKSNFGDVDGSGRQCSAQSVAYIIGQLEKESTNCHGQYECGFDGTIAGQIRIKDSQRFNQRQTELENLLEATRGLAPLATGVTQPDQARIDLRGRYEQFISDSQIGDDLSQIIRKRVESSLTRAGVLEVSDQEPSVEVMSSRVASLENKNTVLLKAIINYVQSPSTSAVLRNEYLAKMRVVGVPDPLKILSGEAAISDETAGFILAELNNDVSNSCTAAVDKIVDDCKLLTPGALYNNSAKSSVVCRDNAASNPLRENSLIVSAMDYRNWNLLVAQQRTERDKAAVQQLMCLQHYDQTNGLRVSGANSLCSERSGNGRSRSISAEFDNPSQLRKLFLTSDASSANNFERTEQVARSFASCSPFAGRNGISNTLMDETAPFSSNFETLAVQVNDTHRKNEQSATNSLVEGTSSMQDSGERARYIRSARSSGRMGGSSSDRGADRSLASESRTGSSPRSLRDRVASDIELPARDRASQFYSDMGAREMEQMASSFNSSMSANLPSITDSAPESVDSARQELEATAEARNQNDALLAQLEELRRQNEELFRQLQAQNISEIEKEDGSVVRIEDAFAETNRRIEEQKAKAMAEREEIDRRTAQAQRVIDQNRVASSNNNVNQASSNFGSNISPTPSSNNNSSGGANISGGRSIASVAPSAASGGSNSGGSSSIQAYGPPSPYQGIVLSSEELSIAKPRLDLGGRSLIESSELVKVAISAVKSELAQRNAALPAYNLNGKQITDYILQEQDGKTVLVYLDGDVVKVEPVDFELEATQVVVEVPEEVEEAPEVVAEPVRAPAAIESQGRKKWSEVEELLQSAND
ncbi:MAG: hypothetical protein CME71_11565 [Halobacteriovorax sp.]|nr:hypothetical protein [Halobacteriovorax sp.]